MSAHFVAGPFDRQHIAQAFPLISLEVPGLTIDRWRAFARARLASGQHGGNHGMLTVRNPAGYIHGLAIFEIVDDLCLGRVLLVSHLVTARSVGSGEAVSVLIAAMKKVARAHDCVAVRAALPMPTQSGGHGDHWLAAPFKRAGFDLQMIPMARKVLSGVDTAVASLAERLRDS